MSFIVDKFTLYLRHKYIIMAIFSGNNIDLKVQTGIQGNATLRLVFDNESIIETYNAVAGEVTIIDFKSLANSFFNFYKSHLLDNLLNCNLRSSKTEVNLQIHNKELLVYANTILFSQIPVADEYRNFDKFISRYPKQATLPEGAIACVNWYKGLNLNISVYWWDENEIKKETFNPRPSIPEGNNLCTFPMTWEEARLYCSEEVDVPIERVKMMTFDLVKDNEIVDSITFTPSFHRTVKNFAFIGALGEAEVLSMRGQEVISDEMDPTFLDIYHQYRKVRTELVKSHTINTGYLRPFEVELFNDMLESQYVCLIADDGSAIPITITDCEAEETLPHVKPTAFKFTYRVADDNAQRLFSRQPEIPNKRTFTTEYTKVFS